MKKNKRAAIPQQKPRTDQEKEAHKTLARFRHEFEQKYGLVITAVALERVQS